MAVDFYVEARACAGCVEVRQLRGLVFIAVFAAFIFPTPCSAWNVDSLIDSVRSSSLFSSSNSSSGRRAIHSNSEVLARMNPLQHGGSNRNIFTGRIHAFRSPYLDREIEIYLERRNMKQNFMARTERKIGHFARDAANISLPQIGREIQKTYNSLDGEDKKNILMALLALLFF